jgi:hypothetical protein
VGVGMNNKGSTLVLLVIVIALVIVLGASVLNVSVKQYEIKKFNIDSKSSFYISETGLNEAYVKSCVLIDESIIKALQMAEGYLLLNPPNKIEAENIFITNYKDYLRTNIENRIEAESNPSVQIWNDDTLCFIDDALTVVLKSSYLHENNIDKITGVELVISVPDFNDVSDGSYDARNYIQFQNWNS